MRIPSFLLLAALAMTTPAGTGSPQAEPNARYLVFELDRAGALRLHAARLVHLATEPVGLDEARLAGTRTSSDSQESEAVVVRLRDSNDQIRFRGLADVPRWLRAEHSKPGSDGTIVGRLIEPERRAFVVRLPLDHGLLELERAGVISTFDLEAVPFESPLPATGAKTRRAGSPDNRMDLLVMGDGYRAGDEAYFETTAASVIDGFFGRTPLSEYRNFVNTTTLFTASNESGADHPPYDPDCTAPPSCCSDGVAASDPWAGNYKDTAFDATFCASNIHRLLTVHGGKVFAAAAAVPDWDQIIVLVNDGTYGGSGGAFPTASLSGSAAALVQHELGHSFTRLADEYTSSYPGYPDCAEGSARPCEANVTDVSTRAELKWSPWVDGTTPIPTPAVAEWSDVVGLFEGARYRPTGMFRPQRYCMMRSLGSEFCAVCSQAYVLKLYQGWSGLGASSPADGIDNIEPGSETPPPGDVFVAPPAGVPLTVELLEPEGGPALSVSWWVDGGEVPGETSASYLFTPPGEGTFVVELQTLDTTPLVHPAMAGDALRSGRTWTIHAVPGTPLLRNAEVVTLAPLVPPLGAILPLDPIDDLHLDNVEPGDTDPAPALTSPLVFYGMTDDETLTLVKAPGDTVRFEY